MRDRIQNAMADILSSNNDLLLAAAFSSILEKEILPHTNVPPPTH